MIILCDIVKSAFFALGTMRLRLEREHTSMSGDPPAHSSSTTVPSIAEEGKAHAPQLAAAQPPGGQATTAGATAREEEGKAHAPLHRGSFIGGQTLFFHRGSDFVFGFEDSA